MSGGKVRESEDAGERRVGGREAQAQHVEGEQSGVSENDETKRVHHVQATARGRLIWGGGLEFEGLDAVPGSICAAAGMERREGGWNPQLKLSVVASLHKEEEEEEGRRQNG